MTARQPTGKSKPRARTPARTSTPRKSGTTSKPPSKVGREDQRGTSAVKPVKLLSGGNPQIAKGDGDEPIQAFIAAMPSWKRDVGRRLDTLIVRTVPAVRKAVKWNSPLYGIEGQGWFLGIHVFTHYVKVAFFSGDALKPRPPGASKSKGTRYLDLREGDVLDEVQFAAWLKQASRLPGWGKV